VLLLPDDDTDVGPVNTTGVLLSNVAFDLDRRKMVENYFYWCDVVNKEPLINVFL